MQISRRISVLLTFQTLSVRHQNITVISLPLNNDENLAVDMFKFFLSSFGFECQLISVQASSIDIRWVRDLPTLV